MNKLLSFKRLRQVIMTATFSLCTLGVFAQGGSVSGTVTDDGDGQALPGVNVIIKGTTSGTVTGADGRYTISVPDNDAVLVFSFVGYTTAEVVVGEQRTIDVKLSEGAQALDEVVVVGYGTLQKKMITSSVTSIKARELPVGVGGSTIANAMEGKISNLVMQKDASPNSSLTLQMRGMASYNASKGPLVVIDGMPGGDIRSVVQEDIQSIDVLKDAAAGAIYGTRATGGVILITTKQAAAGKLRATYQGEVTFKKNFGRPDVMTPEQYLQYFNQAIDYGSRINWWDEGMQNATSQRHLLTLQGGSESAKVYANFMYEDNKGVLMNDNRKDFSGRVNGQFKMADGWIDLNIHLAYRQAARKKNTPGMGQLIGNNPTRSPYNSNDPSGYNIWTGELDDINTIADANMSVNKGTDKWFRPDAELKFNFKPIAGLQYIQTIGYEHSQWVYQEYRSIYARESLQTGIAGRAKLGFDQTAQLNTDGYFSFIRNFGKSYINAIAGYSYYQRDHDAFSEVNYGFSVDGVQMWDIGSGTRLSEGKGEMSSSKDITQRLMAYLARVTYSYDGKYTATASFRREGSSKFAENNRWGNFWSLSAGWRLKNESFLKDVEVISDLNLRVGYGVTGNEGFGADYAATMYAADSWWRNPDGKWLKSYGINKNINPDLGWEEKHEWNIGVDYAFFNNRLFGKIDFFRRNIEGLLYEVDVPSPPYTQSKMFKNIGTMSNTGWEVEIGGTPVTGGDWEYTTSMNLSHNKTVVGTLWGDRTYIDAAGVGRGGDTHRFEEGTVVGSYFLWQFAGFQDGKWMVYDKDGKVIDAASTMSLADKKYSGNYVPTVTIGWTHSLRYKNWELLATLKSWIDFDIYDQYYAGMAFPTGIMNQSVEAYTTNKDIVGMIPANTYFLEDGTFLKIQNVQLSYTLPLGKYQKVFDKAKFYFTANNLYTFTGKKYRGLNPEVDITSWDHGIESSGIYPQTRTFAFGVQVDF